MGKFKQILLELNLTDDQLKDKSIKNFIIDYAIRKKSNEWFQYINGNAIIEINKQNGTSIRTILSDDEYMPEFPENIDIQISTLCVNNCKFCYAGCSASGKHADIKKYINDTNSFLYSLHAGTELAINGNEPLHPDLELLLNFCKERNIFANLTVNETTLIMHLQELQHWLEAGLIHGLGISPNRYSRTLFDFCKKYSTAVIHTIAGITTPQQYSEMQDNNLKLLILGYKNFGRGVNYNENHNTEITTNILWLKANIKNLIKHFALISFDNLGLEQLEMKTQLTENEWKIFFRGNDGNHTLYIDLVNETYAKNSIQNTTNHIILSDDVKDMLNNIKHNNK